MNELSVLKNMIVHQNVELMSAAVALRIADLARQVIFERGVFHLALTGGRTPRRCYEYLRELPVDWTRVQLYFGDERCLPVGDAERNDLMAHEALIRHITIPSANVHRIPAELGAVRAAEEYCTVMEQAGRLDLVLLGLGEDGHTASLFPGNPAVENSPPVVAVFNSPKPPPERVSLSLQVLNAARHKLFLVSGAGKREPLARIEQGELLPAARVCGAEWHVVRD